MPPTSSSTLTNRSPTGPAVTGGLAERYLAHRHSHDELLEADGSVRGHWSPFVCMLDDLGPQHLLERQAQAQRLIREDGITYNVYDHTEDQARPWDLDVLPLLIRAGDWNQTEAALAQRARLLDLLVADLYGEGRCLSEGLLPPELVYNNPGYLRPCKGLQPRKNRWIHLYAADLLRAQSGQMHVVGDRTQAPSGAGYTLENRIVLSRVLPTPFAQCNVLRLAPFFITLQRTLKLLSDREDPRIVLLTPGPLNETYFEHAYLAKYLGYTLAQGNDLTVRDWRVYLKTLGGLQRVDVILRRVDDAFCDPLELFSRSYLGVPGLLQALREGTVAMANVIGAGVVQAPAFLPYLPRLCRFFLSEDLALPSIPTWWCGDPASLPYVLDNLHNLHIKPALREGAIGGSGGTSQGAVLGGGGGELDCTLFGGDLSGSQLAELAARLREAPRDWVAQEHVPSYRVPALHGTSITPRSYHLRSYLVSTGGADAPYEVMPGGMTRFASAPAHAGSNGHTKPPSPESISTDGSSPPSSVVSLQRGGGSKDTWILSDSPPPRTTLLDARLAPLRLTRAGGDLASRVADDLFWLGRYIQRAESATRLLRCLLIRLADPQSEANPRTFSALIAELTNRPPLRHTDAYSRTSDAFDLVTVVFSEFDAAGLRSSARRFQTLARTLRDRISIDAWRILQAVHREIINFAEPQRLRRGSVAEDSEEHLQRAIELSHTLITSFLAFEGMAGESMTRGQGWRFLDLGIRIERGIALARLLRAVLVDDLGDEQAAACEAILDVADNTLTYRSRYADRLEVPAVLDLLLADESIPRGLAYQASIIEEHLSRVPRTDAHHHRLSADLRLASRLTALLQTEDLTLACKLSATGRREKLSDLLTQILDLLARLSEVIVQSFFAHAAIAPTFLGDFDQFSSNSLDAETQQEEGGGG